MAEFIPPEARDSFVPPEARDSGGFVPPEARQEEDGPLTTFGKNVVGIGEGGVNFASGLLAAPAMGLRTLGEFAFSDADMKMSLDRAESSAKAITYDPFTKAGKDAANMFGDAYHAGRDFSGDVGGKLAEWTGDDEARWRGTGETAFDLFGFPLLGKGIGKLRGLQGKEVPIDRSSEPDLRADDVEVLGKREPPLPEDIPYLAGAEFGAEPRMGNFVPPEAREPSMGAPVDLVDRAEPPMNPPQEPQKTEGYGQGELTPPQNPYIPEGVQLTLDENGMPIRKNTSDRIAQTYHEQAPQGDLFKSRQPTLESQLVPKDVQDVLRPPEEQVIPKSGLSLEPVDSIALRNRNPETVDYSKTTSGDIPRETQQAPFQERPDTIDYPGKELTDFGTSGEALRADRDARERAAFADALTRAIGDPMQRDMHPFAKDQSGQINPDVFVDGFKKIKELAGKGITLIAKGTGDALKIEVQDSGGKRIGGAFFDKKTTLPNDFKGDSPISNHQDLFSRASGLVSEAQHKGIMQEVYKFASELGNDVVPSRALSAAGRKMWEGFEKRGVAYQRRINRGPGGKQSGAFDPEEIGKGLAKLFGRTPKPESTPIPNPKGQPPKAMVDQKKYLTADTRPVEQFLSEELPKVKSWVDISHIPTDFLPNSTIATLADKHPAVKWIVDRALGADREGRVAKENSKYGSMFAPKRGMTSSKFNRRLKSDDGALTLLERMPIKESETALRVWLDKYDGKDLPMTPESLAADGLNKTQTKALLAAKAQFDAFVNKYNAAAAKEGFSPIPVRPNYFPHFWKGDYRVIARDKQKNSVWVEGVSNKYQAKTVLDELTKRFPDHTIEIKEAASKFDIDNTDSFREALNILDKNDPSRKILQNAFEEILQKRGFRKQTLFREGKPGYLGTKEGKAGVRDGMDAIEMYFDRGHNFLANQQKRAAFSNLLQGLREAKYDMSKETPNAYDYINAFLDNSTGAVKSGLSLIDSEIEGMGSKWGFGKSAGSNVLSGINGVATAFWLTTPRFALSQLVQPLYNLPKGFELASLGITNKMVVPTFMKAYYETFINPSKTTLAGMNWAKENGFIDSKILDLMGVKFDNRAKMMSTAFQTFSRWGLGKLEQEAVRTPSFIFYDMLLRDVIKNDEKRWTTAGQLTDKYMVDYTKTDAPLFYGKAGIVGEAMRPLKQFNHAYYGQMLEYLKDMKDEKSARPIAAFLGVQYLTSGMKGMVGVAEAGLIIMAINSLFNLQIPTPEELLATGVGGMKDLSQKTRDWITFGPLSKLSGLDMSGTLGAPQFSQMSGFPGVGFATKAAKEVGEYGANATQGLATESDKMQAIQSVTPNLLQGRVEQAFTKDDQGPPNPAHNMIPDLGPRSKGDILARDLGGRSVDESSEMMRLRNLKQNDKQREAEKEKYLDVMVDRLVEGKELDQKLIDGYIERGGDPQSIGDSIVRQIRSRVMTYAERYVGNLEGLSGAQKAQRLQDFHLIADQITDPDELAGLMKEIQNAK